MEQICRVCRADAVTLVNIFDDKYSKDDAPSLEAMLSECTSYEVIRDDPLPQKLCLCCVRAAKECYRFRRQCEQSHQQFWKQISGHVIADNDEWPLVQWSKSDNYPVKQEEASSEREHIWEENLPPMLAICEYKEAANTWNELESTKKSHFCGTCNKAFISKKKLNLHQRFHTLKREHKCPLCPKEFVNPGNLADHIRAHTGERPYKCSHCPKAFTQRGRLNEHIRTHTGERPFKCLHCPKTFASAGNLTVHKRIHSGERPYKCTQCHASYIQPGALQRHIRVHTGDRPFKCSICFMPFPRSSYLKRHMNSHKAVEN